MGVVCGMWSPDCQGLHAHDVHIRHVLRLIWNVFKNSNTWPLYRDAVPLNEPPNVAEPERNLYPTNSSATHFLMVSYSHYGPRKRQTDFLCLIFRMQMLRDFKMSTAMPKQLQIYPMAVSNAGHTTLLPNSTPYITPMQNRLVLPLVKIHKVDFLSSVLAHILMLSPQVQI